MKLSELIEKLQKYRADLGDATLEFEAPYIEYSDQHDYMGREVSVESDNIRFESFKRQRKQILKVVLI